ncbi:MAG: hypothetical protein ACRCV5_23565 [Afipia sp.]
MKKVTLFAAAAAVSALIATPVLAQDSMQPRAGKHMKTSHMKQHHASKKHMRHHARGDRMSGDRVAYQDRGWDNRDTGFWPGNVVAGAVGTAGAIAATTVGTAGAIATAPFGGPYYRDSYAYGPDYVDTYSYNGVAMPYSSNYAARNGFTCQPGTFIKGTRTLCQ